MSQAAIQIHNISKRYKLGVTHAGSIRELVNGTVNKLLGRHSEPAPKGSRPPSSDRIDQAGYFWALRDISFEINQGEVVGLIGKNGAGKSTLLKILSRITKPTSGQAILRGRVASLLEVGTGFHPELTGRENVYLNGTILGMTKREVDRQFDAIVDFSGVDKFIDTPVKRYSSGMTVRLGFAVAAHLEPEILIVDEVLAVGDFEFQRKCLGKMDALAHSGRTVLFVSHSMAAVRVLCPRAVILENGQLAYDAEAAEAIDRYQSGANIADAIVDYPADTIVQDCCVPVSCQTVDQQGKQKSSFSTLEEINLQLQFQICQETPGIQIGFDVSGADGVSLFRSFCNDRQELEEIDWTEGDTYIAQCKIPPELLNGGTYTVKPMIRVHQHPAASILDGPRFSTVLNLPNIEIPVLTRQGMVTPILDWQILEPARS